MNTREEALKAIKEAEAKIAEAKAILKQKEETKLEYAMGCYYFIGYEIGYALGDNKNFLEHARYRDTKEQAKQAQQREMKTNRLEARALKIQAKIDPNWKVDWSNMFQEKYFITFDYSDNQYYKSVFITCRQIGTVYMSEETAEQLVEELNSGRYKL